MPHANPTLENVFGTIGAVLWTIQILPQIWKSYSTKNVEGLSGTLMFVWALASLFLGVYVIVQNVNIPIIIQPQLFGVLSAVSWCQCLYYGKRKYSKTICISILAIFCLVFAGFETGMYFALQSSVDADDGGPILAFGIISAVLLAAALLPQYWEIFKLKEVKGLSLTFMVIDILGGIFCVLSLAFKDYIDGVATANYSAVVILDGIILILALILNPRAKRRRQQQMEQADRGESGEDSQPVERGDGQNEGKAAPNFVNPQTAPAAMSLEDSMPSYSTQRSGLSTPATLVDHGSTPVPNDRSGRMKE